MNTICFRSAPRRALLFLILALTPALRMVGASPGIAPLRAKAEAGDSVAQYYLGLVYAEGQAVPRDLVEAYVWLSLAAVNGSNGIPLGILIAEMSPDQLAAARFRLAELRRTTPGVVSVPQAKGQAAPTQDQTAALKQEIVSFRIDKANLSDELAAAWKETDGAKKATAAAEQRARQVEADLNAIRTRNTALVAANQKLEEQARAAVARTDAAAQTKAALTAAEQRAREAEASLVALQRERDEQAKSLAAGQTAAAGLTAQIKKLGDEKTALAQANGRLEEQAQTGTRQAEQAHRALEATVADQSQKLAALTTELASTRNELVTAQGTHADLTAQLTKLADEKALLTQQAERSGEASQEAASLKTKLGQVESDLSATRARNTALVAANQKLEERARAAVARTDAAAQTKAALAAAEQRAREAEAALGEHDKNLAGLQIDLQTARRMLKDLDAAQAAVAQTTAIAEQNRRERDDLRQQLDAAGRNLAAAQTAAAGRAGENTRQLAEIQLQLQQAKKELAELHSQNQSLQEASQRLERQDKETADAVRQLAEARTAIEQLKHENASLQAQRAALTARLAQAAPAAAATAPTTVASTGAGSVDEVARLKEDLRRAEDKVEMTGRSFSLARQENERLKAQIEQADTSTAQSDDAEAVLARVRQELSAVRAAADKTAAESAALRETLRQVQDANVSLATENARLKTAVPLAGVDLPAGSGAPTLQPATMATSVVPPSAASSRPQTLSPRTHRVVSGDTLTRISVRYYGTASRWKDIYNANRDKLRSADALPLDVELKIP